MSSQVTKKKINKKKIMQICPVQLQKKKKKKNANMSSSVTKKKKDKNAYISPIKKIPFAHKI